MVNEEYEELYSMLSNERDDVVAAKKKYEEEISILLTKVRTYQTNTIDISSTYDLIADFEKFKIDDINLKFNMEKDMIDYKISLLQGYLQDLFAEKKFNDFKREQEQKLSKDEYLVYINNPEYQSQMVSAWYQDFMEK